MTTPNEYDVVAQNLSKSFGGRRVLNSIDLTLRRGEFVALVGASGSGKTTLLRMLGGLSAPDEGDVFVPARRTFVFQEPRLVQSSRVWRNVVLGLKGESNVRDVAYAMLDEVGLQGHEQDWPATLSGGEAQRVAIARALVRRPQLLLLDEPFGALDALTRLSMHALLDRLCSVYHPTTLLVTHDVDEALYLADRILVLRDGAIAHELVVDDAHPRSVGRGSPHLRNRLLAHLGVSDDEPATAEETD
jgi:sulfonate transport system ATP-binding protein